MAEALSQTPIRVPVVPVVANVTAAPVRDPGEIRALLIQQVTCSVRWRESVNYMYEHGVTKFIECGSGKVLSGLLKRILPEIYASAVGQPEEIEAYRASA